MLVKIARLEKLGGFRLRVSFSDGSVGVHDFTPLVNEPGPMLEPLRDAVYFARVFLEFGAPLFALDRRVECGPREDAVAQRIEACLLYTSRCV